ISLSDFLRRLARRATTEGVKDQNLNKKALESLIECGALDSLAAPGQPDGGRGQMLAAIEILLEYHRDASREQSQDSLFAGLGGALGDVQLPKVQPATTEERLAWEKELLGLYVSGHPLEKYRAQLAKRPMNLAELKLKVPPGSTAVAAGMIEDIRTILTKSGDQMAFIKLADFDGSIEAVVFPKNFTEYKNILKPESVIALKGRLS